MANILNELYMIGLPESMKQQIRDDAGQSFIQKAKSNPNYLLEQYYAKNPESLQRGLTGGLVPRSLEALNASLLAGAGYAGKGIGSASDFVQTGSKDLYDYLFRGMGEGQPKASPAPAEEPQTPPDNAAEGKSDTPTTAAQDQALIEAIARQTQAGASGGGGKSTQSPSIQDLMASMGISQMAQQEQPKEDVTDYSKAMLRAGVAMLQADGDIWDALGAGFGAYQDQLDQQEKSVEEKALEAQKMALERQKADAYTMQAMSPYLLRDKGGSGKADKPESLKSLADAYSKPLTGLKNQIDILSTQLENTRDPVAATATKLQLTKAQNDYAAMMNAQMSLFGLGGAATDPLAPLFKSYQASKQQ